jgi:hypothetical protein
MPDQVTEFVARELFDVLNELAGNHAVALAGVATLLERLQERTESLDNITPDSMNLVGYGDPNSDEGIFWQAWPLIEMDERLGPDGSVIRSLGQQWVVTLAARWGHFRERFARAEGKTPAEIREPIMGDITNMRNDVVHHRGVAARRNTGRCEVLRWFAPGEPIHVMPIHIVEVMNAYGLVRSAKDFDGGGQWSF